MVGEETMAITLEFMLVLLVKWSVIFLRLVISGLFSLSSLVLFSYSRDARVEAFLENWV